MSPQDELMGPSPLHEIANVAWLWKNLDRYLECIHAEPAFIKSSSGALRIQSVSLVRLGDHKLPVIVSPDMPADEVLLKSGKQEVRLTNIGS